MISHSAIYAAGNIIRQLVSFIMLPIYTTYLAPADYGVMALIAFAIVLVEAVFGARLMDAVLKFYHGETAQSKKNQVVSTAMWITGGASSIIVLFLILGRNQISYNLFGSTIYALAFSLFSVQTLTQAIEYYGLLYIRILDRPFLFVVLNFCKLLIQLSLNIWLVVYQEMGVMGVAISGLVATSFFAIGLGGYCFYKCGARFDFEIGKKMLIFSWPLWLSGLAILYVNSSSRYFIKLFSSLDEVGLYDLGAKFASMMLVVVWTPFAYYWNYERYRVYSGNNSSIVFRRVFRSMSALLAAAAIGISILSVPVVKWMADSKFHEAVEVVPFLAIGLMYNSMASFFNFGFLVKEKTIYITLGSYMSAAIITIFFFLLIPQFGFIGAAVSLLAIQMMQFLYSYFMTKKILQVEGVLPHVAYITIVVAVVIYIVNYQWVDLGGGGLPNIVFRLVACGIGVALLLWREMLAMARHGGLKAAVGQ